MSLIVVLSIFMNWPFKKFNILNKFNFYYLLKFKLKLNLNLIYLKPNSNTIEFNYIEYKKNS